MCVLKAVMEDPEHGLTYMEVIKRLYPSVLFEPECVKQDIADMRSDGEINDEEQQWLLKRINKIEEVYRVYAANGHSAKSARPGGHLVQTGRKTVLLPGVADQKPVSKNRIIKLRVLSYYFQPGKG